MMKELKKWHGVTINSSSSSSSDNGGSSSTHSLGNDRSGSSSQPISTQQQLAGLVDIGLLSLEQWILGRL
ncbi:hypothetical protein SAMD00019534_092120 [Acytostelium subglobosum LB1]|uniref:hypothetical protein n=1 Tax=Acytostelium subglobosum LB1 TaxID=1410327 RepID=UPI00064485BD|nr:hypothetical protein SAMD00019534_092120 [Acytostelium subglobosum LB1]GAM26037.1 hypothetical protein SAMD00019534_092120 [Acytostelium subglobosum LB1]|eukprot:XP_012751080.1 hypothetical protein SAMD00019534_092120 [Acytostelium subglobosum LB1]